MRTLSLALVAVVSCSAAQEQNLQDQRARDMCTSIGVGKKASADGSTMTAFSVDCLSCDFRIGKVPSQDWPEGSMRPVAKFRSDYPRVVSEDRGTTWLPENIDTSLPQHEIWLSQEWSDSLLLGEIPQVNHTFASIEGLYGIINEKQVAIGESTCGAKFYAGPLGESCSRCTAMFDVSELSRIAMERASTAREAITIMGDLAVEYGFYGSAWDENDPFTYEESGESLTVSDPQEVWVFHVLPDDTATSAVWAAQRVPEGHVTVIANQFIIREVPKEGSPSDDFLSSSNLWEVAERSGVWDPHAGALDFAAAFTLRPNDVPHWTYTTRRVWRVLDYVAPSLGLSPYTDPLGDGLPFSVEPDRPVSSTDIMNLLRDHYEGTPFDMTQGLKAGPYGDPDRYDVSPALDGSLTREEAYSGFFERSIALFRTSYSFVTQSRESLPDSVGALVWLAQYKPSASTFIPLYVGMEDIPEPYTVGSLFAYSPEASWWAYCAVGNWMAKARKFIHEDVAVAQKALEMPLISSQGVVEANAATLVASGQEDEAMKLLTKHSDDSAHAALNTYTQLFHEFIAKYRDGYVRGNPESTTIQMKKLFYPKEWLESVGYFESRMLDALATEVVARIGYSPIALAEIDLIQAQIELKAHIARGVDKYALAKEKFIKAAIEGEMTSMMEGQGLVGAAVASLSERSAAADYADSSVSVLDAELQSYAAETFGTGPSSPSRTVGLIALAVGAAVIAAFGLGMFVGKSAGFSHPYSAV